LRAERGGRAYAETVLIARAAMLRRGAENFIVGVCFTEVGSWCGYGWYGRWYGRMK
jgi:hypothetical protein